MIIENKRGIGARLKSLFSSSSVGDEQQDNCAHGVEFLVHVVNTSSGTGLVMSCVGASVQKSWISTFANVPKRLELSFDADSAQLSARGEIVCELALSVEQITASVQQVLQCKFSRAVMKAHGASSSDDDLFFEVPARRRNVDANGSSSLVGRLFGRLVPKSRMMRYFFVAVAVGLVASIWVRNQSASAVDQAAADPYAGVMEALKEQQGAIEGVPGRNPTIDALREMGLNPGKANTGCLTGIENE